MIRNFRLPFPLLVLLLSVICGSLAAQEMPSIIQQAATDARADARRDVNCLPWFSCGLLFVYIPVIVGFFAVSGPPVERMMGKSPDYVWAYTREYRSTRRGLQVKYAGAGCLTTTTIAVVVLIIEAASGGCEDACNPTCNGPSCNDDSGCLSSSSSCASSSNSCGQFGTAPSR
jgi:hypothetical protein